MEAWKPGLLLGFSCILSHLREVFYLLRVLNITGASLLVCHQLQLKLFKLKGHQKERALGAMPWGRCQRKLIAPENTSQVFANCLCQEWV